ncbi:calcium-binding protein [Alkalinema pantanalense CENA528]|uniref:calcium-binding protein n=1 Tax=Alkalinema pantanalense TaxID=1620705 RepID=UPI003D6FD9B1
MAQQNLCLEMVLLSIPIVLASEQISEESLSHFFETINQLLEAGTNIFIGAHWIAKLQAYEGSQYDLIRQLLDVLKERVEILQIPEEVSKIFDFLPSAPGIDLRIASENGIDWHISWNNSDPQDPNAITLSNRLEYGDEELVVLPASQFVQQHLNFDYSLLYTNLIDEIQGNKKLETVSSSSWLVFSGTVLAQKIFPSEQDDRSSSEFQTQNQTRNLAKMSSFSKLFGGKQLLYTLAIGRLPILIFGLHWLESVASDHLPLSSHLHGQPASIRTKSQHLLQTVRSLDAQSPVSIEFPPLFSTNLEVSEVNNELSQSSISKINSYLKFVQSSGGSVLKKIVSSALSNLVSEELDLSTRSSIGKQRYWDEFSLDGISWKARNPTVAVPQASPGLAYPVAPPSLPMLFTYQSYIEYLRRSYKEEIRGKSGLLDKYRVDKYFSMYFYSTKILFDGYIASLLPQKYDLRSIVDFFHKNQSFIQFYGETLDNFVLVYRGENLIQTNDQDSLIITSESNSVIMLGRGEDIIAVDHGVNLIFSGAGEDWIMIRDGTSLIYGGLGNDTIVIENGQNWIQSDSGNDLIALRSGYNFVNAGDGYNHITLWDGFNLVDTTVGSNVIWNEGGENIFFLGLGTGKNKIYGFQSNSRFGLIGGISYEDLVFKPSVDRKYIEISIKSSNKVLATVFTWDSSLDLTQRQFFESAEVIASNFVQPLNVAFSDLDQQLDSYGYTQLAQTLFSNPFSTSVNDTKLSLLSIAKPPFST